MDNTTPPPNPTPGPPPYMRWGPPPAPRTSALGWKIAVLMLVLLLGFSLLLNLGSLFAGFAGATSGARLTKGPRMTEILIEDNDSPNKLLVVPVEGIIMGQGYGAGGYGLVDFIKDQLERAAEDSRIHAVVLKIDSPGGEVLASDDISQAISKFQEDTGKPVVASMGSVAASGGYYVAAPCRWIVAHELTITGSIGVIMQSYNYRGLMDKVGMVPQVFKSGRFKDMLSGEKPPGEITQEEKDMVQRLVDETFERFKQVVAEGRAQSQKSNQDNTGDKGLALASNWTEYADGRILSGKEAHRFGFVDELGAFEVATKRARTLAGIQSANLVQYQQHFDFGSLFRLLGDAKSQTIKVDLGMQPPALQAGKLYFLSPTLTY